VINLSQPEIKSYLEAHGMANFPEQIEIDRRYALETYRALKRQNPKMHGAEIKKILIAHHLWTHFPQFRATNTDGTKRQDPPEKKADSPRPISIQAELEICSDDRKWIARFAAAVIILLFAIFCASIARGQNQPTGVYNSSAPTLVSGQSARFQMDVNGNLKIAGSFSASVTFPYTYTQGQSATSASFLGAGGIYNSSAPTLTNAQFNPLQLDSSGNLNVNCEVGCGASGFSDNAAFTVGTTNINIMGALYDTGADPTLTNGHAGRLRLDAHSYLFVDVSNASLAVTNAGTFAVQDATVEGAISSSLFQDAVVKWGGGALGAMANYGTSPGAVLVPGVNAFVTNTPAVTGSGVFEVGPTTAANTLSNQFFTQLTDGTHGNTFNSTTYTSKYGVDVNILGTLGTAFTTAGFVDVKGADGNVFVRQATASNLNATVVPGGSAIFEVSPTTAANTVSNQFFTQITDGTHGVTTNSTTYTSKYGIDVNLLGALGTAFGTAGVVDDNLKNVGGNAVVTAGVNGTLAVGGNIADGSALSSQTNPVVTAGKGSGDARVPIVCDNYTPFSLASTTSLKLVSKSSSKQVYICSINIVSASANNVALIEGTKTTTDCDTSTAGMAGGTTAATGWNFAANGGLTHGTGIGMVFATATTNHDVCLLASGSGQVSGGITWTQF